MSKPDRKKQEELIEQLSSICEELGWVIGIPSEEGSDEVVEGLILGTEKFVFAVVDAFKSDYEVFSKNVADPGMKELPAPQTKKKIIFH